MTTGSTPILTGRSPTRRRPRGAAAAVETSERPVLYDVTKAAPGYANVTGLVSTFALAAVVLVFLIAATAARTQTGAQKVDMGFATILFALGFMGCLIAAFTFASLGGGPNSAGLITNSMLVGSIVSICLIAVLGGFAALSHAFLAQASNAFAVMTALTACLAPVCVWFAVFDIAVDFPDTTESASLLTPPASERHRRPNWLARVLAAEEAFVDKHLSMKLFGGEEQIRERAAVRLLTGLTSVGVVLAIAGLAVHFAGALGHQHQWEYYALGLGGFLYTGFVIVAVLVLASNPDRRLSPSWVRALNVVQCLFAFFLIAILP